MTNVSFFGVDKSGSTIEETSSSSPSEAGGRRRVSLSLSSWNSGGAAETTSMIQDAQGLSFF